MIKSGTSGRVLVEGLTDPTTENAQLSLVCESTGGSPPPRLTWYRDKAVVDDVVEEVDAGRDRGRVRNTLRMRPLRRGDQGQDLTCKAANTNLTAPAETSVKINMVCKYHLRQLAHAAPVAIIKKKIFLLPLPRSKTPAGIANGLTSRGFFRLASALNELDWTCVGKRRKLSFGWADRQNRPNRETARTTQR